MQTTRISALLEPFLKHPLSPSQLDQISTYIDLLQRWNSRINLTAIRNEEEIVTRHFGESLFLARHVFPPIEDSKVDGIAGMKRTARVERTPPSANANTTEHRVLDIGSGAGFPALPRKIWSPEIHLTLIESNHKKSAFLKEVSRALTFTNINVITERAEALAERPDHPRAELVTLRAVEHFEATLPQALHFLADQATLALLIGTSQLPLLSNKTLKWNPPIPIPRSNTRVLQLGRSIQQVIN